MRTKRWVNNSKKGGRLKGRRFVLGPTRKGDPRFPEEEVEPVGRSDINSPWRKRLAMGAKNDRYEYVEGGSI